MDRAYITGTGMALGNTEVTNDMLCEMFPLLATSDEWLMKNVGIRKRHFCDEYENLVDLLAKAGAEAVQRSGIRKIDRLIVGSNTQARHFPATASKVAQRLNESFDLATCWCLDIQNGCPSGVASIGLGVDAIRTGQAETVLALGGDITSRMVDWFDRNACLLMGDGASAFVVTGEKRADLGEVCLSVLSHWEQSDYESADIMRMFSATSDYSPFEISRKTRDAARETVKRITGEEIIPTGISKETLAELAAAAHDVRKIAFAPDGRLPYSRERYPHFIMEGAEVLEKIRRIVPDCGYLPVLRNAGIGMDLFEKYDLLETNRVSDIPVGVRKEFMKQVAKRFDLLIPHQANLRGHQNLSAALRIPMNRIYSNIAHYANTSAAATGIALYESLRQPARYQTIRGDLQEIEVPRFDRGQKAVAVSFGSGTHVAYMTLERLK
jgi:3-oxoacyl-[acyl-carrier-protein] synthase III